MSGAATILAGRCEEHLPAIPDGSVALVFTSPPYNIGKPYELERAPGVFPAGFHSVPAELYRVLRHGGWVFWQVGNHVTRDAIAPLDLHYHDAFVRAGFVYRRRFVWAYGHGLHCTARFSGRYETIACYSKGGAALGPDGFLRDELATGVLHVPNVKHNHPEKNEHPCSFPVELVERAVLSCTTPGETVLDVYGGSGSAAVAAVRHGRHGVCIECDESYVAIARARVDAASRGLMRSRAIGKPIPGGHAAPIPHHIGGPLGADGPVSLVMGRAESVVELTAVALVHADVNVVVICDSDGGLSAEARAYRLLSAAGFDCFNRVVVAPRARPYQTLLCFRRGRAPFYLDAVRVPQKYPNKKSARTGLPSCHPDGKNPSDFWAVDDDTSSHLPSSRLPPEAIGMAVAAFCGPGDAARWVDVTGREHVWCL